ncbi:ATP-binding protein [Runella slithyformis]|uniref:histidine kinase n=1 Tax=Runella slithyformis (strain ATCC 29530 / DSM 19594 / LMG 11500 / NCIMB 11436 / LSU 4) TaxID=761193 RepID=A0A7U3ZLM4_RUNSL|nr:ATP-binding protein [Runella slithyformis]AEI49482.1 integral membrane sensor signal transduction histidine kinase [Runella slithyformis DSM 19594]
MKKYCTLFLLLLPFFSQSQQVGINIQRGEFFFKNDRWKFRAGDSLEWAKPEYNDGHWQKAGLSLRDNKALWQAQKGWFRLQFSFSQTSLKKDYNLILKQFGQSELYVDGQLVASAKASDPQDSTSQVKLMQIPFNIKDTNTHVIALRYSFRSSPLYYASTDQEAFKIWLEPSHQSMINQLVNTAWNAGVGSMLAGLFGILSLLHFLFFRANPNQRVHLILAFATFCFTIMFALSIIDGFTGTLTQKSLLDAGQVLNIHLGFGLLLAAVYTYLKRRHGWFFYLIIVLLAVSFGHQCFIGPLQNGQFSVPFLLVLIDYIRVSWLGKRHGGTNDKLPWNSLRFSFFALLMLILAGIIMGAIESFIGLGDNAFILAFVVLIFVFAVFLGIPVGLSLSLVQDYTHTYKSMRLNLEEVQKLSAKTLAQEQEKQQILATQNETLERQVSERTAELNQSLETLKATQAQLIQKEKMASLGELTAGVAHEIQNPLNFVNNFSEVSVELLDELLEEREKAPEQQDLELEKEIFSDLRRNLQKITHHGQRAGSIVRSMLAHSRTSSGQMEPTNLNALTDEYLRLAYHGQRAAQPSFNCQLITDFSSDIPTLTLAAQDMGRVLLNLYTNAFYALHQKQQTTAVPYEPTLWVSTAVKEGKSVEIRIRDNGPGIPEAILQKVFQPFFTTKPTGEGTGLGLSLSYDIVTKAHQGSLEVTSTEGEGTEFVITLPVK